tara:strand:- start:499 stop:1059 length:561 start_codon:yes stop_codon:yes gene_type:complete
MGFIKKALAKRRLKKAEKGARKTARKIEAKNNPRPKKKPAGVKTGVSKQPKIAKYKSKPTMTYKQRMAKQAAHRKKGAAARSKKQQSKNMKKINRAVTKVAKKDPKKAMKMVSKAPKSRVSKLKPTGKIKKGFKKVTITEGGAYPTYKKKSSSGKSFRKAFAGAKGKNFTWQGRKYSGKKKKTTKK